MFVKTLGPAMAVLPAMASAFGGLGFVGPMAPAPTLLPRDEGTPVQQSPPVITSATNSLEYSAKFGAEHANLLKARGFCSRQCEWDAFCVESGGYGGCCSRRYTSCWVASTCVDWITHQDQISTWDVKKTIMCPAIQPYCTSSIELSGGFVFVDCGTNPVTKQPTTRPTTVITTDDTTTTSSRTTGTSNPTTTDDPQSTDDGSSSLGSLSTKKSKKKGFGAGAGAGIAIGGVVLIAAILGIIFFIRRRRKTKGDTDIPTPPAPPPQSTMVQQSPGYYPPQEYGAPPPPPVPYQVPAPAPGVHEAYAPTTKPLSDAGSQGQYNSYYAPSTAPSNGPGPTAPYYQQMQPVPPQPYSPQAYSAPPQGEPLYEAPGAEVRR